MGNSLAFPGIQVRDVVSFDQAQQLDPQDLLIGEGLDFSDFAEADGIVYKLRVAAARPELAKVKARAYARAKNPFEPDLIWMPREIEEDEEINLAQSWYNVRVYVHK